MLPWALKILMIALVTVAVFIYRKPFSHLFSAVGYGTLGSHRAGRVQPARGEPHLPPVHRWTPRPWPSPGWPATGRPGGRAGTRGRRPRGRRGGHRRHGRGMAGAAAGQPVPTGPAGRQPTARARGVTAPTRRTRNRRARAPGPREQAGAGYRRERPAATARAVPLRRSSSRPGTASPGHLRPPAGRAGGTEPGKPRWPGTRSPARFLRRAAEASRRRGLRRAEGPGIGSGSTKLPGQRRALHPLSRAGCRTERWIRGDRVPARDRPASGGSWPAARARALPGVPAGTTRRQAPGGRSGSA